MFTISHMPVISYSYSSNTIVMVPRVHITSTNILLLLLLWVVSDLSISLTMMMQGSNTSKHGACKQTSLLLPLVMTAWQNSITYKLSYIYTTYCCKPAMCWQLTNHFKSFYLYNAGAVFGLDCFSSVGKTNYAHFVDTS